MEQVLTKFKIKTGTLPRLKEYIAEFEVRRRECAESLEGEGVALESFFLDPGGEHMYVLKQAENLSATKEFQRSSNLPIYDVVRRMAAECIESRAEMMSVLDLQPG